MCLLISNQLTAMLNLAEEDITLAQACGHGMVKEAMDLKLPQGIQRAGSLQRGKNWIGSSSALLPNLQNHCELAGTRPITLLRPMDGY